MKDTIDRIVNTHSSSADGDGRPTVERSIRACLKAMLAPASVTSLPRVELDAARNLRDAYENEADASLMLRRAVETGSSVLIQDAEEELDSAIDYRAGKESAFMLLCGQRVVEVKL